MVSFQYVFGDCIILSFFSILRWWYAVSVCLSAFSSHQSLPPSHNPESDGGGNVDFSGVGIGSEQRGSEQRASENYQARVHSKRLARGCVSAQSSSCAQPYCLHFSVRDTRSTLPSGGSFREGKLSLPLTAYLNLGAVPKFIGSIYVRKVHHNLEGK